MYVPLELRCSSVHRKVARGQTNTKRCPHVSPMTNCRRPTANIIHVTDQLPDPAGNPLESLLQDFIVWRCGRSFFSSPVICPWHSLSLRPRHLFGTPCSQTPIASPSFLRVPSIYRIPHCGLSSAVAKRKETDLRSSDGLSNYNLPDLQIPSVSHGLVC